MGRSGTWSRWRDAAAGRRERGRPPSANAASSMHCFWSVPPGPLRAVSAVCEVVVEPSVDALYFWALQVSFVDDTGRDVGGAHCGLQWHPSHPARRAVNFGGYDTAGRELDGTVSRLPSATSNPNTRDFAWRGATRYRITIEGRSATVTDLRDGTATGIRRLDAPGSAVRAPVVWSEVFARCDDPGVVVRWSEFSAVAADGTTIRPESLTASYQRYADGGCTNTDIVATASGIEQRTATSRTTPDGTLLRP